MLPVFLCKIYFLLAKTEQITLCLKNIATHLLRRTEKYERRKNGELQWKTIPDNGTGRTEEEGSLHFTVSTLTHSHIGSFVAPELTIL